MKAMRYAKRAGFAGPLEQRDGAVLILALLVLALVTVMGVYSATRTSLEQQVANNMKSSAAVFYAAEAGLNHARSLLEEEFVNRNQTKVTSSSDTPDWSFVLDGSVYSSAASNYWCETGCLEVEMANGAWIAGGVQIIQRTYAADNVTYTYTVTAWDNDESHKDTSVDSNGDRNFDDYDDTACGAGPDTDPTVDCDGNIAIRSVAVATVNGAEVASAILEMNLVGSISNTGQIVPGLSQEFVNSGKTSSGSDLSEIAAGTLGGAGTAI